MVLLALASQPITFPTSGLEETCLRTYSQSGLGEMLGEASAGSQEGPFSSYIILQNLMGHWTIKSDFLYNTG